MTSTDLYTDIVSLCKRSSDPDAKLIMEMLSDFPQRKASSTIRSAITHMQGQPMNSAEDAIKVASQVPGGVIMYVMSQYYYFEKSEMFKRFCQNHTRPRKDGERIMYYYFVPATQKHNVAILFDGTDLGEYKTLCKHIKNYLDVDARDVQIIPAMYDDCTDIIIKSKLGSTTENSQLVDAFRRYVRDHDRNLSNKISKPDYIGDQKIGEFMKFALSYKNCDTKSWEIEDDTGVANIVVINIKDSNIYNISGVSGPVVIGDNNLVKAKLESKEIDIDNWVKENPPTDRQSTSEYFGKYKAAAGKYPKTIQDLSRAVKKLDLFTNSNSGKIRVWRKIN